MASKHSDFENADLVVGISGIVPEEPEVALGNGVVLRPTYGYLMEPMMMAFIAASEGSHHPGPWMPVGGHGDQELTAQITISQKGKESFEDRLNLASSVTFMMRLANHPSIRMLAISNRPFESFRDAKQPSGTILAMPHRHLSFAMVSEKDVDQRRSLSWVERRLETAHRLRVENPEFRTAVNALERGPFLDDTALVLISLWGALEVIFSPHPGELRFRVSSNIAAYMHPPGLERLRAQQDIAALYDKRSAAAHGKPKHQPGDLVKCFELLRRALIRMIDEGAVPSRKDLEQRLYAPG